jgi:hypothetical protein
MLSAVSVAMALTQDWSSSLDFARPDEFRLERRVDLGLAVRTIAPPRPTRRSAWTS